MMNRFSVFSFSTAAFVLSLLSLLLLPLSAELQAQEAEASPIGRVISAAGLVQARSADGTIRNLARRSDIFVGDTIITGTDAAAQIRMLDSAVIAFREDTEFSFDSYRSDDQDATGSAVMTMVRGGFRTISGSIGEDASDEYRVETQFASIGIRGTTHEAVIDAGSLLTGVYDGGITIANNQGTLDTGINANFDYSQTFPGQAPQGLLQQPAQLGQININPGVDEDEADEGTDDGDGGAAGVADGGDGDNDTAPPPPAPGAGGGDDGNATFILASNSAGEGNINPLNNLQNAQDFQRRGSGTLTPPPPPPAPPQTPTPPADPVDPPPAIRPVLTAQQISSAGQRLGFTLGRNAAAGAIFPGNASVGMPGQPFLLIGNNLATPRSLSQAPGFIFMNNGSFNELISNQTSANGAYTYDFTGGLWGSSSDPVRLYSNYQDDSTVQFISNPMLWVSVLPSPLADLTGTHHFASTAERVLGGSSLGGGITDFHTSFNVNFTTGSIFDGFMSFCIGGGQLCKQSGAQFWQLDYSGTVRQGYVVATPVTNSGTINGQSIAILGLIHGIFTGNGVPAMVGGFNLYSAPASGSSLSAQTVDGIFLVEREQRISNTELRTMDSESLLVQGAYARNLFGISRSTSSNGSSYDQQALFLDLESRPYTVFRDSNSTLDISQRNQNLPAIYSTLYGVSWERWQGPLNVYRDNFNAGSFTNAASDNISDIAFFSTFTPSRLQDITGTYSDVLGFIGENAAGNAISSLQMRFDVNFSQSLHNISNGRLDIDLAGTQTWIVHFDGQISNSLASFNILPGENSNRSRVLNPQNGSSINVNTANSNMRGVVVDNGIDPAMLSSFLLRTTDGGPAVFGQALVGRTDERLLELGFSRSDLNSIGFAMPVNSSRLMYTVLATDASAGLPQLAETDPQNPFNPESFGDILTAGSSNVYVNNNPGYYWPSAGLSANVSLGYWNSVGSQNSTVIRPSPRAAQNSPAIQTNYWGLVHDPVISLYSGRAHFNNFLYHGAHLGTSASGNDPEVLISFDVDFANSLTPITNGWINVCIQDYSCNSGIVWEGSFTGTVKDGYMVATNLDVTRYNRNTSSSSPATAAALQGMFTGNTSSSQAYTTLLGGFNFQDSANNDYATGIFLADSDPVFSSQQVQTILDDRLYSWFYSTSGQPQAIVNIPQLQGSSFLNNSFLGKTAGTLGNNLSSNAHPAFFYNYLKSRSINDNSYQVSEVFDFNRNYSAHTDQARFTGSGYTLEMGFWNSTDGAYRAAYVNTSASQIHLDEASFNSPAFWLNYTPTSFSQPSGHFNQVLESFTTFTESSPSGVQNHYVLDELYLSLTINLLNGSMTGQLSSYFGQDDIVWYALFDNAQQAGSSAFVFGTEGSAFSSANGYTDTGGTGFNANTSVELGYSGNTGTPILAGAYQSRYTNENGGFMQMAGIFAAGGFVEDRLTASELVFMRNREHMAMFIPPAQAGKVLLGAATAPDSGTGAFKAGLNEAGAADLFKQPYQQVASGIPNLNDDSLLYPYDADWGYWDSEEMTILNNRLNSNSSLSLDDDTLLAFITPAADIADRTGSAVYYTQGAIGGGVFDGHQYSYLSLNMELGINFSSNSVSSASFSAEMSDYSIYEAVGFTLTSLNGSLDGAVIRFDDINGNISRYDQISETVHYSCTACISGQLSGVIIGTQSSADDGIIAGFSLHNNQDLGNGNIQGIGLLGLTAPH